jgi:hypothetical protein
MEFSERTRFQILNRFVVKMRRKAAAERQKAAAALE